MRIQVVERNWERDESLIHIQPSARAAFNAIPLTFFIVSSALGCLLFGTYNFVLCSFFVTNTRESFSLSAYVKWLRLYRWDQMVLGYVYYFSTFVSSLHTNKIIVLPVLDRVIDVCVCLFCARKISSITPARILCAFQRNYCVFFYNFEIFIDSAEHEKRTQRHNATNLHIDTEHIYLYTCTHWPQHSRCLRARILDDDDSLYVIHNINCNK